ncbi:hypothetical protein MMC19_005633 [Ptychographa xylographoides]|nr:hypothetical protein [Ptychographa xylographoides]
MRQAEEERFSMAASIEKLEADKRALETSNARTVEENHNLLDQLEDLNNAVSESDSHIQALTATLHSTRQELQKLTILAGRTAQLEAQLSAMEMEQAGLQSQLSFSEESNRSAVQRWKRAERTIEQLQDQVDRIEREANEESERHAEVEGRMARRRAVEKELDTAAGRLKSAAAFSTLERNQPTSTNVVSHFVKDILQDNANLQMGIVELREMLMDSNAEVQSLKEQMLLHYDTETVDKEATLRAELVKATPLGEPVSEVHVHHHYHGPEASVQRKPRKKRIAVSPGHFLPSSGASTPRTPRVRDWKATPPSSVATILSHTSVTIPPAQRPHPSQRDSIQSSQSGYSYAPSSMPSSPRSVFRASSVFDSIDSALDSSRPTSPETSMLGSPTLFAQDQPQDALSSYRSCSAPMPLQIKTFAQPHSSNSVARYVRQRDDAEMSNASPSPTIESTIPEEPESDTYVDLESPYLDSSSQAESTPISIHRPAPPLRRATSHESLISISGMDIHTLRNRPSQMFTGRGFAPGGTFYPMPSPTTKMARESTTSLVSPTTATAARPAFHRHPQDSRSVLSAHARNTDNSKPASLGKIVGGWVWGKNKGGAALASPGNPKGGATATKEVVVREPGSRMPVGLRSPGVNQSGPILGLKKAEKAPSVVRPKTVDRGLLEEVLRSGGVG